MYLKLTIILCAVIVLLHIIDTTVGQAIGDDVAKQYGQIGGSVTLTCDNTDNGAVEWKLNDSKIIQTRNVELTRTKLILFNINVSQEGQYRCHNPESGKIYRTISLMLGYPPGKPQVTCQSVRYPLNVVCLWKLENQTYLPTRINASYRYGVEDVKQCSTAEELQGTCTIEGIQLFSKTSYTVKVTATNPLGSRSTITQFIVEKIIKPDPPTEVNISPIPNQPKKLLLQWKPPVTWPDPNLFLLKYRIMYWPKGSTRYQMNPNSVDASHSAHQVHTDPSKIIIDPFHPYNHTFPVATPHNLNSLDTMDNLAWSTYLTCASLDCGMKPEHLEEIHADMGKTCKLHTVT